MTPTEIITPNKINRRYTAEDKQKEEAFQLAIVTLLELPVNWERYLTFRTSDSFITLKQNTWHNAQVFRRFSRGKVALVPDDLKETVLAFVNNKIKEDSNTQTINEQNEKFRELVKEYLIPFNSDKLEVVYQSNDDITKCWVRISITEKIEHQWQTTILGTIAINHAGQISKPAFPHNFGYGKNITIDTARQWIENNKELAIKLNDLALTIKAALPSEFFVVLPLDPFNV